MAKFYQVLNTGVSTSILMSNTMYITKGAGATATVAEVNAAIGSIRTFYLAMVSLLTSSTTWTPGFKVTEFDTTTPGAPGVILATTPGAVVAGTGGVQTINQAAICVSWRTALAGRSYRGRTFLGVLAASAVAGGTFTSGQTGTVTAGANALVANLAALGTPMPLIIYSRKLNSYQPVTTGSTDNVPDVLRSRKR